MYMYICCCFNHEIVSHSFATLWTATRQLLGSWHHTGDSNPLSFILGPPNAGLLSVVLGLQPQPQVGLSVWRHILRPPPQTHWNSGHSGRLDELPKAHSQIMGTLPFQPRGWLARSCSDEGSNLTYCWFSKKEINRMRECVCWWGGVGHRIRMT